MSKYMRSNSILSDPQQQLEDFVKANNIKQITRLLVNNRGLLAKIYDDTQLSILEVACLEYADTVEPQTIKILLDFGADPKRAFDEHSNKSAVHFAALGQNPKILEVIALNPNVDINATSNGRTALHLLIIDGDPDNNMKECVEVLWRHGIDLHSPDTNSNTALYFAAKNQYMEIVKFILSKDNTVTSKEADVLRKLDPSLHYVIDDNAQTRNGLDYLKRNDETGFISWCGTHADFDEDTLEKSFLQTAIERHLLSVVDFLIDRDPNKVGRDYNKHPLIIAVENGYYQIVERLVQAQCNIPPNLLNEALQRADWDGYGKTVDYQRSCELILDIPGLNVNERDAGNGNYPLHYAVKFAGKKNVAKLLQNKASLANCDDLNLLSIAEIDHDTLKKHFDSCLVAHPGEPKDQNREGMYFTFDYTTLFPTPKHAHGMEGNTRDCESQKLQKQNRAIVKESDVVLHLTKDKELKPLLQHPLIVTFLYVKWHRVRCLFIANLVAYLLFCASLLWYILTNYNQPDKVPVNFPFVLLFITTLLISVREAFQMVQMKTKYLKNAENYVEVFLLVDVYLMLFYNSTDDDRRPMFAFAILLAALELLFLLGSIPGMSTYIVMLRTVSFNFLKFLLFNAILILAFAFSFYTLFRKSSSTDTNEARTTVPPQQKEVEEEEKKPEFFANIYLAVFKTIVMLTGEFEAGDLQFEKFPVASHLIFIMFVLLIAIILLNLLNGLAVSDTQEIKNEAKLVALTARAQYVSYVESMVFDNVLPSICTGNHCACDTKSSWSNWMLRRICIKQHLEDNCLKVYPNQEGRIAWRDSSAGACTPLCGGNKIDEGTLKLTKTVISRDTEAECSNCQQMYAMVQELLRLQTSQTSHRLNE